MTNVVPSILLTLAILFPVCMSAQQSQPFTLAELTPGSSTYHRNVRKSIKQLQWCGEQLIYQKGDTLWGETPKKDKPQIILTKAMINAELERLKHKPLGSLPHISVQEKGETIELLFSAGQQFIVWNLEDQRITLSVTKADGGTNYDYNPKKLSWVYTKGNDLFLLTSGGKSETISSESEGILCGQAVHQQEFGIRKGTFWSPEGNLLAFYRMDESMVAEYPLVNIAPQTAELNSHRYPMAGTKSHHVTVGVYNPATKKTIYLKTGLPKEKYLTNIAFSPDEKVVYVAELNRGQDHMDLVAYSATTGDRIAKLFSETHDRYVEPQNPVMFIPGQSDLFIWQSQRSGFNHLYLYNTKGELLRPLSEGKALVTQVLGFDSTGDHLFYTVIGEENPLNRFTIKLNIGSGKSEKMSDLEGVHHAEVRADGRYIIDHRSAPSVPYEVTLIDTKKASPIKSLLKAKNPYEGRDMPSIESGSIKAADGSTDLYYRLTRPATIKAGEKLPTIVYVYGGPHAQLVTGGWLNGVGGWDIYMASRGYVVFTVDGRGSANRGFEFESVIHRQLGVNEMADQMKGIEFLKSLPYVDQDRIGVSGWSYGGFMTTNLMCTHPETFKVGTAGGPVIDWRRYEIMYGERYMDHPKENPEGYKNSDLTQKAGNLKGRLLLIHGDVDPVVVFQHGLLFMKAAVNNNSYPDCFIYPGHQHNVLGQDRVHLMEKITRYFDDHL